MDICKHFSTARHHYELLGVHRRSTPEELAAARRRLAKLVHPDTCSLTDAHDLMARVNAAYAELLHNKHYAACLSPRLCAACKGAGVKTKQVSFTRVITTVCPACAGSGRS